MPKKVKLDENKFIELYQMYLNNKCSKQDIANHFQCSFSKIYKEAKKLQFPRKITPSYILRDDNGHIIEKKCSDCGKILPPKHFSYIKMEKGLCSICRKCRSIYRSKFRRDPKNWSKVLLGLAKRRAKKKNVVCNISQQDIEERLQQQNYTCPVFDISYKIDKYYPNNIRRKGKPRYPYSPSIDETIPGKGYTKDNIDIISFRANTIKNDGTLEEFEALVKYLKERLNE